MSISLTIYQKPSISIGLETSSLDEDLKNSNNSLEREASALYETSPLLCED